MPALIASAGPAEAGFGLWLMLPFALLLGLIAAGPLAFPRLWERWYPVVAIGLGAVTAGCYLFLLRRPEPLLQAAEEYASFIILIGALYVIAGGIHMRIKGEGTPAMNCLFLLIGAVAANFIGTTGASMLLIRPWIRLNRYRITGFHTVFFIFLVSNIGGCLTPIGDPPLFLGYIKGVPFWWVLQHCWSPWAMGVGWLLAVFYVIDRRNFRRAPAEVRKRFTEKEEWRFEGLRNVWLLIVALSGIFLPAGWREGVLLAAATVSWFSTPQRLHKVNDFSFHAVSEVAWLFAGIFITMIPALEWLEINATDLAVRTPGQFYWRTGALSSVLDNAPTYLAFLAAACGLNGLDLNRHSDLALFAASHPDTLSALSISSVFFGAMTYLGNGPNLMVKSIAMKQKVEAPGFLAYIFRYAVPILLPSLILIGVLFFSSWRIF